MQKYLLYFVVFIFCVSSLRAQETDSLINLLPKQEGETKAKTLNKIGWSLRNSEPREALKYIQEAIDISTKNNFSYELTKSYSFIGVLYRNMGVYTQALENYQNSVDLAMDFGYEDQLGYAYNNFANLYLYQEKPELSVQYLQMVLPIASKLKNEDLLGYAYQNLGRSYLLLNKFDSARFFLEKTLELREQASDFEKMGVTYKYLGDVELEKNSYSKAMEYYKLAQKYSNFEADKDLYSDYCNQLSILYLEKDMLDSALHYATISLNVARVVRSNLRTMRSCEQLAQVFSSLKDYQRAYSYEQLVNNYKDSLYSEQVSKQIASIEFSKEQLKKQSEIELLQRDLRIEELYKKRITFISAFLVILILIGFVALGLFNRNRKKMNRINNQLTQTNQLIEEKNKALKEQSVELEVQANNLQNINNLLEIQYKILEDRQTFITDSINYASRIQKALMPSDDTLGAIFSDFFVLNIPRDIVSGDFYWVSQHQEYIYLAVADSTGHGVSGSFMSVLSISLLNEIINMDSIHQQNLGNILNLLRSKLKSSLGQKSIADNKDGLDISLVKIYKKEFKLEFSGAHNDAYLISGRNIEIIDSQRMPVAISRNEEPFVSTTKTFSAGDKLYLSTDGFQDQVGGVKGRKYFKSAYRDFLVSISVHPLETQKQKLNQELKLWQADKFKQIDDILVLGVQL